MIELSEKTKLVIQIHTVILILLLLGFSVSSSLAAKCEVSKFPMEKPIYQVFREGKRVSQPDLACKGAPVISPSGKYIAFTDCERDYNRLGDQARIYRLVIFNCETGRDAGFLGDPVDSTEAFKVKKWSTDESSVALAKIREGSMSESMNFPFGYANALP